VYSGFACHLGSDRARLQRRRNDPPLLRRDQRWRRCTDVITSTCALDIDDALHVGLYDRRENVPRGFDCISEASCSSLTVVAFERDLVDRRFSMTVTTRRPPA
jgi:hypothetical protein